MQKGGASSSSAIPSAPSATAGNNNANLEERLSELAQQVSAIAPLHKTFLARVENSVSVSRRFENEAADCEAEK